MLLVTVIRNNGKEKLCGMNGKFGNTKPGDM